MRFGIYVPTFGEYDVPMLAALARDAEAAGWDGFFIWDHLLWAPRPGSDLADTTVALTAIALATERIRFGALVTPLARRRPWKLAKELAALDRLSSGRLVVGVGLGAAGDVAPVGEARPERERAGLLDEGLEVLAALWSGEPVTYVGRHFRLEDAAMRPTPLQRPRIPIWVAGFWPNRPPLRRAARWDGILPLARGHLLKALRPDEFRACLAYVRSQRSADPPFESIAFIPSAESRPGLVPAYEKAGATWWVEAVNPLTERLVVFRARIANGPPG